MSPRARIWALRASLVAATTSAALLLALAAWSAWAALEALEAADNSAPILAAVVLGSLWACAGAGKCARVAWWALRRPWAPDLRRALDELGKRPRPR